MTYQDKHEIDDGIGRYGETTAQISGSDELEIIQQNIYRPRDIIIIHPSKILAFMGVLYDIHCAYEKHLKED